VDRVIESITEAELHEKAQIPVSSSDRYLDEAHVGAYGCNCIFSARQRVSWDITAGGHNSTAVMRSQWESIRGYIGILIGNLHYIYWILLLLLFCFKDILVDKEKLNITLDIENIRTSS
jgi:hypothetical protein